MGKLVRYDDQMCSFYRTSCLADEKNIHEISESNARSDLFICHPVR